MSEKLDGLSMDVANANMEKLKAVFPECFAEGKLDIDKLLTLCGEYIEDDSEKYKFEWKGKIESLKHAQTRSTGTLRPCKDESVNFDDTQNIYIEGDNLEVLKLLQTAYYNKIKMIYIDPPYNTGNDFVYADDFADPMARYKEITQQTTKSNPETMGRFHTNWLNMMYPRLRLAANLLTDDGVIFISIDDNEVFNLKKICDEVFGEENFVANILREAIRGGSVSKNLRNVHDYILCYAKNIEEISFGGIEVEGIQLNLEDEHGKYAKGRELNKWGAGSRREDSPSMFYPIPGPNGEDVYPIRNDGSEGRWRLGKTKMFDLLSQDNAIFEPRGDGTYIVYEKLRNDSPKVKQFTTWFSQDYLNAKGTEEIKDLFNKERAVFDFSKPTDLIKAFLQMNDDKECIILDFFSGSATTAHAVMKLNAEDGGNRKFICVQLPELCDEKSEAYKAGYKNICEIGKERIRRAASKIRNEEIGIRNCDNNSSLDLGFKVFKLDTSNLKTWDYTPITGDDQLKIKVLADRMNSMIDTIKDDRTDMDVVYEVMLKMGVPLDIPVQYTEINDNIVYIVGDFLLMIALYNNITAEDIDAMSAYAPAKIICAEQGFADDSALSNAHYILKDK
ncbi:MAG: site-specific DNA-methyltransferase, partial [Clostridia bacterium]|nr:site-specific DNA-methyltransferase [Clostridia bacterium]